MRDIILQVVKRLINYLNQFEDSDLTYLDPNKSAATLIKSVTALERMYNLHLQGLGVGELMRRLSITDKNEQN